MTGADLVSVVIPAYNAAKYLPQTLETVFSQSHENCEIILVDDGSTDDTVTVIAPYLQRIRYIRRDHAGIGPTRNAGIEAAEGDYIALLDADDIWSPDKIERQLDVAKRHLESGLIACDGVEFDGPRITKTHLLSEPIVGALQHSSSGELTADFHRAFIWNCLISCPSQVMLPRHVMREISPLEESSAQDYEIYLRASQIYPVTFHADQLVRWRYSSGSASGPRGGRIGVWAEAGLPLFRAQEKRCRDGDRKVYGRRIRRIERVIELSERQSAPGTQGLFDRIWSAGLGLTRRVRDAAELHRLARAIKASGDAARPAGTRLALRQIAAIMMGRPVGQ